MLNTKPTRARPATVAGSAPHVGRVVALVAGDVIVFLLFSAQGRSTHGEANTVGNVILTAAPFLIGWFAVAPWLGAFGRRGRAATMLPTSLLRRTALSWIVAWAAALLLRFLVFRGGITPPFAIVALLVNGALLLGWRGVVSALFWRR